MIPDGGAGMGFYCGSDDDLREECPAPQSTFASEAEREPIVARDEFRKGIMSAASDYVNAILSHQYIYSDSLLEDKLIEHVRLTTNQLRNRLT